MLLPASCRLFSFSLVYRIFRLTALPLILEIIKKECVSNMKKVLAVLLTVALVLGALGSVAFAEEKIKITMWHIQDDDNAKVIYTDAAARFMADYPNVEVEVVDMQNDVYKDKIAIAMAAGELPDIFLSWSGGPMIEYATNGIILDLTAYMEEDNYKDKFLDAGIAQGTYDGKIWGIPGENVSAALFFYDKEFFAANGFEVPTTIAELETLADACLAIGVYPFALANLTKWTGSMYYMYLVARIGGGSAFDKAANQIDGGTFESEPFEMAGEYIQKWVKAGYFNDGFNSANEDDDIARWLLYNNQAAMYLMGNWAINTTADINPDFLDKMGVFAFPAYEGGTGDPDAVVGTVGDNFYHIAASCENPDMAFKFLQYTLDDTAIATRVAIGKIPPVKGVENMITDENLKQVLDVVSASSGVQLWYDQYLPSSVAQVHLETLQAMFGLAMTPAEADALLQEANTEALSE